MDKEITKQGSEAGNQSPGKQRKSPVRSPLLFPAYDFAEALKIAERVERLGGGMLSEEALAIDLHSSITSSGFLLRRLTAGQFKLLEKKGDNLVTTPLAKGIIKSVTDDERRNSIRESFLAIPLFNAVANKYKGVPVPTGDAFRNVLEREFKIPADRVASAERSFTDSAREAGLLTVSGGNTYLAMSGSIAPPDKPESKSVSGDTSNLPKETPPPPPVPPPYISQQGEVLKDDDLRRLYVKKLIDNIPILNTQGKDAKELESQNSLLESYLLRIEKLLKLGNGGEAQAEKK